MKSPKCQTENPEAKKICRKCGTKLSLLCPQIQISKDPPHQTAIALALQGGEGFISIMNSGFHRSVMSAWRT